MADGLTHFQFCTLAGLEHVHDFIGKCTQSLHGLKLLLHHGMSEDSLRHVYKAVVLSKLLYASPSWWGYTSAANKQRLEASVRRAIWLGLYSADDRTPSQLAAGMDDNLFANILNNPHRVLHKFLPRTKLITPTILDLIVTLSH